MLLKGEVSPPDTHSLILETATAHKHGAGIIKMKDTESLRVRTTQGLEAHPPPGPTSDPVVSRVTVSVSRCLQFISGPAGVSKGQSHTMFYF